MFQVLMRFINLLFTFTRQMSTSDQYRITCRYCLKLGHVIIFIDVNLSIYITKVNTFMIPDTLHI